jgi:hypothetical protein
MRFTACPQRGGRRANQTSVRVLLTRLIGGLCSTRGNESTKHSCAPQGRAYCSRSWAMSGSEARRASATPRPATFSGPLRVRLTARNDVDRLHLSHPHSLQHARSGVQRSGTRKATQLLARVGALEENRHRDDGATLFPVRAGRHQPHRRTIGPPATLERDARGGEGWPLREANGCVRVGDGQCSRPACRCSPGNSRDTSRGRAVLRTSSHHRRPGRNFCTTRFAALEVGGRTPMKRAKLADNAHRRRYMTAEIRRSNAWDPLPGGPVSPGVGRCHKNPATRPSHHWTHRSDPTNSHLERCPISTGCALSRLSPCWQDMFADCTSWTTPTSATRVSSRR